MIHFKKYYCHIYGWHLSEGGELFANFGENTFQTFVDDGAYILGNSYKYTKVSYVDIAVFNQEIDTSYPHVACHFDGDTVISKWNDRQLIKHKIDDLPIFANKPKLHWTNKKQIDGTLYGAKTEKIGKEINSKATISSAANIAFRVAPMNNACIVLDTGFHALPGSKFRAYVSGHHPSDDFIISSRSASYPDEKITIEDIVKVKISVSTSFDFDVFPNPSSSNIKIKANNSYNIFDLNIYDMKGNVLKKFNSLSDNSKSIDVSEFSSGLYFIELISIDKIKNINTRNVKLFQISK